MGPLGQRSEAARVGLGGRLLPLRRPLDKVPSHRFANFKAGLTSAIYFNLYRSRGVSRILLNEIGGQSQIAQAAQGFRAKNVLAQTAGRNSVVPEKRSDVGEVGGRSAELLSGGEEVPKQLADTGNCVS